jgi:hypothetical protein
MASDIDIKLKERGQRIEMLPIDSFKMYPLNNKKHGAKDLEAIHASIKEFGFADIVICDADLSVVAGHGRIIAAKEAGISEVLALILENLSPEQIKAYRIAHNQTSRLSKYNDANITQELSGLKAAGMDLQPLQPLKLEKWTRPLEPIIGLSELKNEDGKQVESLEAGPNPSEENADTVDLNAIYPSDNELEIPSLLLSRQPKKLDTPINRWGTQARSKRIDGGLIHFYTDDYKFTGILNDPLVVLKTGCVSIIEPNFSTNDNMRRAVVQYYIYLKRYLARTWQEYGLNVWVDLAVAPRHRDLALLGVPKGYRCYATYTYTKDYNIEWLHQDFEQALKHSEMDEKDLLFYVYGGNKDVEKLCSERGWLWTEAHQQAYHHNVR